jgi:predicted nuclease with TOPRIM domain
LPAVEALQQLDARHEEQKEKLEQLFRQQKEELEKQMEKLRKQMKKLDQQFRERSEKLEQSYIVNCQEILALIPGTSSQKVGLKITRKGLISGKNLCLHGLNSFIAN